MPASLLIGAFISTEDVAESWHQLLTQESFIVSWNQTEPEFVGWVTDNRHRIDCLVVEVSKVAYNALAALKQRDILLPVLVVGDEDGDVMRQLQDDYHSAIACTGSDCIDHVEAAIRQAVASYLELPSGNDLAEAAALAVHNLEEGDDKRSFLLSLQQQRLAEKLKERLGYMGVYYKRNPKNFLRNIEAEEKQAFIDKLREDYRQIILIYFSDSQVINQKIDDFVNVAFFADVSVPRIVEIHMELIDDFSKQLRLEGRSDDILTDYRLTLIDVIAHLCEMYRRSIPREM